jgi:hypothetical protein
VHAGGHISITLDTLMLITTLSISSPLSQTKVTAAIPVSVGLIDLNAGTLSTTRAVTIDPVAELRSIVIDSVAQAASNQMPHLVCEAIKTLVWLVPLETSDDSFATPTQSKR